MKIQQVITEAVSGNNKNYVRTAVSQILGEDISAGQTVAIVEDPVYGANGIRGRVKSISDSNAGFATVALENGTELLLQTSLLVPV